MRELVERREVHARRAGVFGHPRLFEQRGEGIALVVADGDDAPGGELAMVGSAQRERDDVLELRGVGAGRDHVARLARTARGKMGEERRSEEHTSELQSLMRISYAVFCLKKKKTKTI